MSSGMQAALTPQNHRYRVHCSDMLQPRLASMDLNGSSNSPEYELVRLCSRAEVSDAHKDQIHALIIGKTLDWEHLIRLAAYHGVQPFLYSHLHVLEEDSAPKRHMARLRALVGARSAHSLVLFQELSRLASLFQQHDVQALVVKGAALAQRVYGSVAMRPFVDIDFVIRREQFGRIEALLRDEGYEEHDMSELQKRSYLYIHGQYTFWHQGQASGMGRSMLDIHTAIMPVGYSYSTGFDELWERSQSFVVGGEEVRTPATEDLLLILSYHGFKNRWGRLKYICDVAELIRTHPDLDWSAVRERVEKMHSQRVLGLGLYLASEVLGLHLPDDVHREVMADRRVCELGEAVITRLPQQVYMKSEPYWERVRFNLYGQDTFSARLRYAAYGAARHLSRRYLSES